MRRLRACGNPSQIMQRFEFNGKLMYEALVDGLKYLLDR